MINLDEIRKILKASKIYVKENNKNFVCACPYCGDHRNVNKRGHLYVSKDESIPVSHCWLCNISVPISKLLFDLTGKNDDKVIKLDRKIQRCNVCNNNCKIKTYKLPVLIPSKFPYKNSYIQKRTFGLIDTLKIPNLIFDSDEFFKINNIDPIRDLKLTQWELTLLQHNFVIFLSKHHTMLYCRNINPDTEIKFRKIFLQRNNTEKLLDYYEIDLHRPYSNTIILSEGNFDILGCYVHNSLNLNDKVNTYASGCTFSYGELLKSVCYDKSIYNADVYILSDNDKQQWHYKNFIKNAFMASSINIVYNRFGKDFGVDEQQAIKVY